MSITLTINGLEQQFDVDEDTPLLWVLREEAGQTGTKYGCGIGLCGACTVHVDGRATRSCITPLGSMEGRDVVTIEGLPQSGGLPEGELHALQVAWIEDQVPQCGYCQPGMIMAAAAILKEIPDPSKEDIVGRLTNICRCGTYPRIVEAIRKAASRAG